MNAVGVGASVAYDLVRVPLRRKNNERRRFSTTVVTGSFRGREQQSTNPFDGFTIVALNSVGGRL